MIAMVLLFGVAMLSARDASLRWLAQVFFSPGLKAGALFVPGGAHSANPAMYVKLSIFLSLILWWVVIELIWAAVSRLRARSQEY